MRDPTDTLIMGPGCEPLIANPDDVTVRRIGHYDLQREIGRGGMSVVYEAKDARTGQEIALKLLTLPPTLTAKESDSLVARFKREARTAARLSHPNVVRIYEIGVEQRQHFLAMEYLPGKTLRVRMNEGKLTPPEAMAILTQVAGALDAVHKSGIIHRDVKPTNVMLLPDGTAKLLDFGIARSSDETTITNVGVLVGSPSYMAPEQISGEPGTAATDLWALGVLSYEMLSGHLPFTGQTIGGVMYQIMHQSTVAAPDLPPALQSVLQRALDKRPAQRYPTASAFIQALKSALPEQVQVPPKQVPALPSQESVPPAEAPVPKAAAPSPRSIPQWQIGGALLILFLLGFWGAVLERNRVADAEQRQAVAQRLTQKPAPPQVIPASVPDPAPVPYSIPVVSAPLKPQIAPHRHRVVAQSVPAPVQLPIPPVVKSRQAAVPVRKVVIPARKIAAAAKQISVPARPVHVAQATAPQPALPRRLAAAPKQIAAQNVPAQAIAPHVLLQSVRHSELVQGTDQHVFKENAPRNVPVQNTNTVQSFTLPTDGSSYDPEADARLRKSAWSQNGPSSAP
ncbi:MAG: protein kinase domain-containing protein [Janthinobacterium lividum]